MGFRKRKKELKREERETDAVLFSSGPGRQKREEKPHDVTLVRKTLFDAQKEEEKAPALFLSLSSAADARTQYFVTQGNPMVLTPNVSFCEISRTKSGA